MSESAANMRALARAADDATYINMYRKPRSASTCTTEYVNTTVKNYILPHILRSIESCALKRQYQMVWTCTNTQVSEHRVEYGMEYSHDLLQYVVAELISRGYFVEYTEGYAVPVLGGLFKRNVGARMTIGWA